MRDMKNKQKNKIEKKNFFQIFMKWYDIKPRDLNRIKNKKTRSKSL